MLANVIFPAFSVPYVSMLVFPVAGVSAIGIEVFVFRRTYPSMSLWRIIGIVLLANAVSWGLGHLISMALPSGLVPRRVGNAGQEISILQPGPLFGWFMAAGFLIAFLLSIFVEYGVWRLVTGRGALPGLFRVCVRAHLASYGVLIAIALGLIWVMG